MTRQIAYWKTEIEKTPNWKDGRPVDLADRKSLCVVKFFSKDDKEVFDWTPAKWELNLLIDVARSLVKAEDLNFPLLKNPEPRADIEDLKVFLGTNGEIKK